MQRGPATNIPNTASRARRPSWDGVLVFTAAAVALFARFRTPVLLLASYQDDFYYYLKVAQNLAATGVSTFNGITLTNGYHPLWMAVLVCLLKVFHGTAFFVALQGVSLAAAMLTWLFVRRTLRLVATDTAARAGALTLALLGILLIRYGMEITAALPLAAWLIWRLAEEGWPQTPRRAASLGLLAALTVLARLDTALLIALLIFLALLTGNSQPHQTSHDQPRKLARATAFLAGLLPLLLLYLALNWHFFHLLTPVSGLAKQMRTSHLPSARVWLELWPRDRQRLVLILPQIVVLLAGIASWTASTLRPSSHPHRFRRRLFATLLLFPILHWTALSILSDWPVWPWYFYSFTLAAVGALGLLLATPTSHAQNGEPVQGTTATHGAAIPARITVLTLHAYSALLLLYIAAYAVLGPDSVALATSSAQVARYMDAHPGLYMMGDQAGTTAYLAHQPILQMEGLVMDRAFLQQMRAETPLKKIAQLYHADFYVAVGQHDNPPCLDLLEPGNAGPTSPRMAGRICHAPLATYSRNGVPLRIFRTAWFEPDPH